MAFYKRFPKPSRTSVYPRWEEVKLTEEEEKVEEQKAREDSVRIIKECIDDSRAIMKDKNLRDFETNMIRIAIALFDKRASHQVYWKERKAKEKFDKASFSEETQE